MDNTRLEKFAKEHFTFINQFFGDQTVREVIAQVFPNEKYRFEIEEYEKEYSFRTLPIASSEKFYPLIMNSQKSTGTAVVIGRLEAMVPGSDQSQSALQDELDACESYLSMIFHRYIEKNRIKLHVANRESITGFPYLFNRRELKPINPFGYSRTGDSAYQLDLVVDAGWKPSEAAHWYRLAAIRGIGFCSESGVAL